MNITSSKLFHISHATPPPSIISLAHRVGELLKKKRIEREEREKKQKLETEQNRRKMGKEISVAKQRQFFLVLYFLYFKKMFTLVLFINLLITRMYPVLVFSESSDVNPS